MIVTIHGTRHPRSRKFTWGSSTRRADRAFRFICKHVQRYGSLDEKPRPVWIEEDGSRIPAHTYSINNIGISYDIPHGDLPLNTLRYTAWLTGAREIFWIYQEASNDLIIFDDLIGKNTWEQDHKINNWWRDWLIKDKDGNPILNEQGHPTIGTCYGGTVRRHDLMHKLLEQMYRDPDSRRHIISLWQDEDFLEQHGLKPCVHKTQFVVRHEIDGKDYLDTSVDIRSWDYITAGAINQIQYIIFAEMVARHLGYKLANVRFSIANLQIYDKHLEIAKKLCKRRSIRMNPKIVFETNETDFFKIPLEGIKIKGYDKKAIEAKNPQVKIPVAV